MYILEIFCRIKKKYSDKIINQICLLNACIALCIKIHYCTINIRYSCVFVSAIFHHCKISQYSFQKSLFCLQKYTYYQTLEKHVYLLFINPLNAGGMYNSPPKFKIRKISFQLSFPFIILPRKCCKNCFALFWNKKISKFLVGIHFYINLIAYPSKG